MRRNKPSADGTKQYWRCATTGCQGTAESAFGSTIDLLPRINHNPITCVPSPTAIMIKKKMNIVKQVATTNPVLSSHQIVTNAKEGLSMEEIEAFPEDSNIKRRVTNARRPIGAAEADLEPAIMVLSEDLKTTANGERFLLYDSRNDHPEKPVILIYASEYGLNLLRENRKWSGDGTFFSCPKHFKQLYTLNIFKEHSSLPTVFFLLPGKSEEIYKRAFDALTRLCPDLDPDMFMADFEMAPVSVLKRRFLPMVVKFCLFHYSQSLFKNFQKLGLVELYQNSEVKARLRSFNALAFLPDFEVEDGFDDLVARGENLIASGAVPQAKFHFGYVKYIERTYIRRFDFDNLKVDALFPVKSWNHFLSVRNGTARTNNAVEGWHHTFNKKFAKNNMSLSHFIIRLKEEEDSTRQMDIRNAKSQKVVKAELQIKSLVDRYAAVDVLLRNTANRVKFLRHLQPHTAKFYNQDTSNEVETMDEYVD
uniref:MULE transposase domain-containing protein n=1 Tax=Ditylenchus dipsaci TaxID=166011 RepID=A0A915DT06_9BILA